MTSGSGVTSIPRVQTREPLLCLLAVPDRPPQMLQQPAVRSEGAVATDNVGGLLVVVCPLEGHGRFLVAASVRAGGEEKQEPEFVVLRHWGVQQGFLELLLVAVVLVHAVERSSIDSRV